MHYYIPLKPYSFRPTGVVQETLLAKARRLRLRRIRMYRRQFWRHKLGFKE